MYWLVFLTLFLSYLFPVFSHEPEIHPIIQVWKEANQEYQNKNLDSACLLYTKAIQLAQELDQEQDYIFLYTERASINDSLKKYQDAVHDWTKVIDLSPAYSSEVFDAHWQRGLAYYSLGDEENLVKDFSYVWNKDQRTPRYKFKENIIEIENMNWHRAPIHEKEFIIGMFKRMKLITCDECINVSPSGKCILNINRPDPDHPCCGRCEEKIKSEIDCYKCDYAEDREKERQKKEQDIRNCKDNCTRIGVLASPICSYLKHYACKAACATAVAELTRKCHSCCDYDSWYDACLRPLEQFIRYPEDWRDCDNKEDEKQKQRGW